jgi:aminoglycoside phosphotransferase (APT) family kinase protein
MLEPFEPGPFRALQQRSWNLSSLWRLESPLPDAGGYWLKEVPAFMKHEAAVLRWLHVAAPGAAPRLLAADDAGRSLLAHVAGEDSYGASVSARLRILARLHDVQRLGVQAVDELVALGIPDLRGSRHAADHAGKLQAWLPDFPGLEALLLRLERALSKLNESGLPATLVHSDNHPGNARLSPDGVTILDWGEAFVGNPVTDILSLCSGLAPAEAAPLFDEWCAKWKDVAPHSRPQLALEAAPFVAAMHGAATYAHFLHHIEETEWPYHREDVPRCLRAAQELLHSHSADSFAKNR